jgi:hypothetical protein
MILDEVAKDVVLGLDYTGKRTATIITGLEFQINLHLLKLAAIRAADEYGHWRNGVTAWLPAIAAIRLKPLTKPAPARFYFDILFDEPFGGNEIGGVAARLQLLQQQFGRLDPDVEPERLAARLRAFHSAFAEGCGAGRGGWTLCGLVR